MKVLLVDDDRTVRYLLKVILVRSLGCAVVEAQNGLEALERLSSERFDLVLLDVNMPIIDGPETLRAIRESSDHAALPVVMISSDRQDVLVRRCIALGITDYITKPFTTEQITSRLARLRHATRKPAAAAPPRQQQRAAGTDRVEAGDAVLVAEGSADYRHFLVSVLKPRFTVLEADCGPRALKLCLESRPRAVLVGMGLGVLGPAQLVAHARQLGRSDTLFVGLLPQAAEPSARLVFDRVIARGFVPAAFMEEFEGLFTAPADDTGNLEEALERNLVTATEQFCGMVLGTEVSRVLEAAPPSAEDRFSARVKLSAADPAVDVQLRILCNSDSAAMMFNQAVGGDPESATDDDKVSVLGEAANIIAGRLQNSLAERGIRATGGLPALSAVHEGGQPETSRAYCFSCPSAGLSFHIELSVAMGREEASAPPPEVPASA